MLLCVVQTVALLSLQLTLQLLIFHEELDQYNGCYYEDEAEACQKEIDDRHDLVDVLLLQTELQQR